MTGQGLHKVTLQETMARYQRLRALAHRFTVEQFKQYSIEMRDINYSDAVEADKWSSEWGDPKKAPTWEWVRLYNDYHTNAGAKRFDAALLANGVLCALCYGVPTSTKLTLKIHSIARKPTANPLQGHVLDMLLVSAFAYARLLKCQDVWICEPMNEILVNKYQKRGFMPIVNQYGVVTHLTQKVKYD